jgi:hypothetical protein
MSGLHHDSLFSHLFPLDGKEAVAVALCGRHSSNQQHILLVHDLMLIPIQICPVRTERHITWPADLIRPYLERLSNDDFAIVKFHSHPGGYSQFSEIDDLSDSELFESVFGWAISDHPHASVVMLPGGKMFGRYYLPDGSHNSLDKITVAGHVIQQWGGDTNTVFKEFAHRTIQAFGELTYRRLRTLKVGVIGCSGTGSPTIEQLKRLGVAQLVLADPDKVEVKNLNRIINSTMPDALAGRLKVDVIAEAIERTGLGTIAKVYPHNLYSSRQLLNDLISCDIIIGCMDSVDGRHLLNQLCTHYIIPYFDIGVKLEADGLGSVDRICATVHYIQPGRSSLLSRGVYTTDDLRAAGQYRQNPTMYHDLKRDGYIANVAVGNPAVISVNMHIASHAVNELLNRLHPYKANPPSYYAQSTIDVTESFIVNVDESDLLQDKFLMKRIGRGEVKPFIGLTELTDEVV